MNFSQYQLIKCDSKASRSTSVSPIELNCTNGFIFLTFSLEELIKSYTKISMNSCTGIIWLQVLHYIQIDSTCDALVFQCLISHSHCGPGNLLPQPLRIFCFLVNLGLKYFLFKTTLKSFHFLLADFNTQGLKDSSTLKKAYRKAKLA